MNKEEIQEYLKRVDELELRLDEEDKDTLQWLIFGYNECAKLLYEKEQELDRLNNVINELKEYINKNIEITKVAVSFNEGMNDAYEVKKYKRDIDLFTMILDKLKELKEE